MRSPPARWRACACCRGLRRPAQPPAPAGAAHRRHHAARAGDREGDGERETPRRCARWRRPTSAPALLSEFVQSLTFPKATRSAVKERDRAPTRAGASRLLLEDLTERGHRRTRHVVAPRRRARRHGPTTVDDRARRAADGRQRAVPARARSTTEYDVQNLVVTAPDLTLTLPAGTAFLVEDARRADRGRAARPRTGGVLADSRRPSAGRCASSPAPRS